MILTIEPVFTVWAKSEFLNVLFRSCTLQWLDEGGGGGGGGGGKGSVIRLHLKTEKATIFTLYPNRKIETSGEIDLRPVFCLAGFEDKFPSRL